MLSRLTATSFTLISNTLTTILDYNRLRLTQLLIEEVEVELISGTYSHADFKYSTACN